MRIRYTIRGLLCATTAVTVAFGLAWSYPKSKNIPLFDDNETTALYRGFTYSTDRVYRLVITPYDESEGYMHVEFAGPGSNPYSRYNPAGTLLEHGDCSVNVWGEWIWVEFDDDGNPINDDVS